MTGTTPPWTTLPRQDVLEAAADALSPDSGRCGVVIVGRPGVGRTTVARSVALAASPAPPRWVVGTETGRNIPLGAFGHLLTTLPDVGDRLALLTAARALLADHGSGDVLVVDDAHLLDPLSATLLHQLVLTRSVRAVVTLRSDAPALDAVTSLWKDGLLTRLDLAPLSRDEVDELLATTLPGSIEGVTAERIWEASEGNPLIIRSLVVGGAESGSLRKVRGVWQLRGSAAVTSEMESLFGTHLDGLGPGPRQVVEVLAFGGPMNLATLQAMSDEGAIEEAEQRDLIRVSRPGSGLAVRLAHTGLGVVVRARTGTARARRLRGELAARLAADTVGRVDRLRIATLLLDSDATGPPGTFTDAAAQAVLMGNLELAERLSRRARESGGGFEAGLALASTLAWLGRGAEAERVFAELDDPRWTDDQRSRAAVGRAANLHYAVRDADAAFRVLDNVRSTLRDPGSVHALDAVAAVGRFHLGELTDSLNAARAVLSEPGASTVARAWAAAAGALSTAFLGRIEECADMVSRWRSLNLQPNTGLLEITVTLAECQALTTRGDLDAAHDRAAAGVDRTAGQHPAWAMASVVLGKVLLARGRLSAARHVFEQSAAALDRSGIAVWRVLATIYLSRTCAQLGDAEASATTLRGAEECLGPDLAVYAPDLELTRAWSSAAARDLGHARDLALSAADLAADAGQSPVEVAALHAHTRFGGRRVAGRLRSLAEGAGAPTVRLASAHADAFEADEPAALESVSREFEASGDLLSAACAAAQAAALYTGGPDHRRRLAASARANALSSRCDDAPLPALDKEARPLPLTGREIEIATLVASGLTNREIAERLVVSVRTVEGHLYRMSGKLGVHDRGELGRMVLASSRRDVPR